MSYRFINRQEKKQPEKNPVVKDVKKTKKMSELIRRLISQLNVPITGGTRIDPVTNKPVDLQPPSHATTEIVSAIFAEAVANRNLYVDLQGNIKVESLRLLVSAMFDLYVQITAQVILYREESVIPDLLSQLEAEVKEQS